jgi:hypothetical protein
LIAPPDDLPADASVDTVLLILVCLLIVAVELLLVVAIFAPHAIVRAFHRLGPKTTSTGR